MKASRAVGLLVMALLSSVLATSRAQDAARLCHFTRIEDPSPDHCALDALHRALRRAEAGEGVARLVFWGASHTASDQYTGVLRSRLARRFGDGGLGLVMPARPYALYDRRDVEVESGPRWHGLTVRPRVRNLERLGRAGYAIETSARTWGRLSPRDASRVRRLELWALAQPGGGSLELSVDDEVVAPLSSASETGGWARAEASVERARRIEVHTSGDGPVRVFGVVAESERPGVIVESFGVPGAHAGDQLAWDEALMREQVSARAPDLIALAYGTNESGLGTPLSTLEADLRAVLGRWHRIAPEASCLVIGPSDWPMQRDGELVPRPRSSAVRDLYRRVALAEGCGFFDLLAFQGGPGSIARWQAAGLALGDNVHMTDAGHAHLALMLERALLHGYDRE